MKRLILMRHAEAQPDHLFKVDRDRTLSGIGLKQVDSMGQKLHQKFGGVDYVLCSNARRTRQTFDGVKKHLPSNVEVSFEDKLYGAAAHLLLERLRRIEDRYQNVLVLGHNPGLQQFLNAVIECKQPPCLVKNFQTCSAAFFDVSDLGWFAVNFSSFQLADQIFPSL